MYSTSFQISQGKFVEEIVVQSKTSTSFSLHKQNFSILWYINTHCTPANVCVYVHVTLQMDALIDNSEDAAITCALQRV